MKVKGWALERVLQSKCFKKGERRESKRKIGVCPPYTNTKGARYESVSRIHNAHGQKPM